MRTDTDDMFEAERLSAGARLAGWIARRPKDAVALLTAVAASGAILVNALFLQSGPHPAPLFSLRPGTAGTGQGAAGTPWPLPRPRPVPAGQEAVPAKPHSELIADIQRELAKRAFYDGPVDGVYGPRTEAAVRDFERAAKLGPVSEPNETLLHGITHSVVKGSVGASSGGVHGRKDPIADLIGPSSRILAVQRALSEYGYGQIRPTGVLGPDTAAAIEKFERDRHLPVTGQMSDRLLRELEAVIGRPLQ